MHQELVHHHINELNKHVQTLSFYDQQLIQSRFESYLLKTKKQIQQQNDKKCKLFIDNKIVEILSKKHDNLDKNKIIKIVE